MQKEYITHSAEQTEQIGQLLAAELENVTVVTLHGGLGAGKTTLARGIARGLGCTEQARSPTYAIVNEYPGKRKMCHFDMYRLSGPDELFEIGWDDYLDSGALCVVEWGERAGDALPRGAAHIYFEDLGENARKIRVEL